MQIFTLVQSAIIFRAIDKGFGTSIELLTREALDELQKVIRSHRNICGPNG